MRQRRQTYKDTGRTTREREKILRKMLELKKRCKTGAKIKRRTVPEHKDISEESDSKEQELLDCDQDGYEQNDQKSL